jgi:hypothetical protein
MGYSQMGVGRRKGAAVPVVALVVLLSIGAAGPARADTGMLLVMGEERVRAGPHFAGGQVGLFGLAPEDTQIYLVARGPEKRVPMDRHSGGAAGPLTVEAVVVAGLPGFYQILSSAPLEDLPPTLLWETGTAPDYRTLQSAALVWLEGPEKRVEPQEAEIFARNLFRIYEKRGLYGVREGSVIRHGPAFYGRLVLPPDVPAGRIEVRAYAVRDGVPVAEAAAGFTVERTGLLGNLNWDGVGRASVAAGSAVAVLAAALAAALVRRIVRVLSP